MHDRPHHHGVGVTGPFILISLGLVLLLQQLNLIHWSLWEVALRLWPLLIIAVGADILVARRSFLGAVASLLVLLALLVGGIYLMGAGSAARGEKLASEEVAFTLGDASSGDIQLSQDAGTMNLKPLAGDSPNVVEGTIRQSPNEEATTQHEFSGTVVRVVIQSRWPQSYFFHSDIENAWDLALTRRIPLALDLSLGAGKIDADLTGLTVRSVDVKIGAGQLDLTLPSGSSGTDVTVSIGAGSAKIHVPEGAEIEVDCTTGVGNCNLPNGSGVWGQTYTSPGYNSSENKIRIQINIGVGEAEIIR
jgi:hypothetical protein